MHVRGQYHSVRLMILDRGMSCTSSLCMQKIGSREGGETLVMNDKYFFGLLEGMIEGGMLV